MRVLLLGAGAREHALGAAIVAAGAQLHALAPKENPGLARLANSYVRASPTDAAAVVAAAKGRAVDLVVIGPEAPLAAGIADAVRDAGIAVFGPSRAAARIESSKAFARAFLTRHGVPGIPAFAVANAVGEVDAAVARFAGPFVVKPVGLSAGKGVWVQGRDFATAEEGAAYAKRLLTLGGDGVLFEERLEGEEFSLMALVTDSGLYPLPAVLDYKRALDHDGGANTGGMGSCSQRDHLLPFLSAGQRDRAVAILERTVAAFRAEGLLYRGVLYGGFMLTARGPYLVEYNARFGDPEGINVAALYEPGDFARLLEGVATGRVDPNLVRFRLRASVVKYVVPPGYGSAPKAGGTLTLDEPGIEAAGVKLYFADVEAAGPGRFTFGTSRGIALVGEASAIHEASHRVDAALKLVQGEFYCRRDIGTKADLDQRTEHMRTLFVPGAKPSPLPLSVAAPDAPISSAAGPAEVIGEAGPQR
jgi:phosphoribosylamine---glycine ligase